MPVVVVEQPVGVEIWCADAGGAQVLLELEEVLVIFFEGMRPDLQDAHRGPVVVEHRAISVLARGG